MKKQSIQFDQLGSLQSAIEQLQGLVDGLRAGQLILEHAGRQLSLKPASALHFALHATRERRSERLELALEWRRQELNINAGPQPAVELDPLQDPLDEEAVTRRQPPRDERELTARPPEELARSKYQELYTNARVPDAAGELHLDESRFVEALVQAGLDPVTQSELYHLAGEADAAGRAVLFEDEERPAPSSRSA